MATSQKPFPLRWQVSEFKADVKCVQTFLFFSIHEASFSAFAELSDLGDFGRILGDA